MGTNTIYKKSGLAALGVNRSGVDGVYAFTAKGLTQKIGLRLQRECL
jgi:hypothetical protein